MSKQVLRTHLPKMIGGTVLLLVMAGMVYMVKSPIASPVNTPKKTDIKVFLDQHEPPPPPNVKPSKPKKIIEEKPQVADVPPPDEGQPDKPAPPGDPLKTTLGPGNDANGLPPGSGGTHIDGGGGSRARWYANLLASRIEQTLNRDSKLLDELKAKRITVRVWVGNNGRVERVEWEKGTVPANSEPILRDQLLTLTMQEAPDGVAQPIWYRFRPRG